MNDTNPWMTHTESEQLWGSSASYCSVPCKSFSCCDSGIFDGKIKQKHYMILSFSHSTSRPLPVTCLKAPYWSASSSHIPSPWLASCPHPLLFRSYISPPLPCLVTLAPENGDSMFLRNVGIDLQIHTAPKPKTSTAKRKQTLIGKKTSNQLQTLLCEKSIRMNEKEK
jgi:hypothetical protein